LARNQSDPPKRTGNMVRLSFETALASKAFQHPLRQRRGFASCEALRNGPVESCRRSSLAASRVENGQAQSHDRGAPAFSDPNSMFLLCRRVNALAITFALR
jgi:hypothetical protein